MVKEQFGVEMTFAPPAGKAAGRAARHRGAGLRRSSRSVYRAEGGGARDDADGVRCCAATSSGSTCQAIDQQWKDHLLSMDHLRQGIGLRGYGQKDPKQEYKKEGYEMFVQMTWRVKSAVVGNLLRLQLVRQESAEEIEQKRLAAQRRAMQRITETPRRRGRRRRRRRSRAPKQETVVRTQPKVGRNDPCPCGSGKKYKKCHGATEAVA